MWVLIVCIGVSSGGCGYVNRFDFPRQDVCAATADNLNYRGAPNSIAWCVPKDPRP